MTVLDYRCIGCGSPDPATTTINGRVVCAVCEASQRKPETEMHFFFRGILERGDRR